jgi:hypothetical protein
MKNIPHNKQKELYHILNNKLWKDSKSHRNVLRKGQPAREHRASATTPNKTSHSKLSYALNDRIWMRALWIDAPDQPS